MKNVFSTGIAVVLALVILAVAIPINLIAGRLDVTWDMTPKGIFALTEKTKDILKNLDRDVYVYPLFELEELKDDKDYARQLIPLYNIYNAFDEYEHITVISADPETDKGRKILQNVDIPQEMYITKGDTLVICNGLIKRVLGNAQISTDSKNGNVRINAENDLTSAINYVAKGIKPVVYFLTGHGELPSDNNGGYVTDDYSRLEENMFKSGYNLEFVDLTDGSPVPEDAKVLLCVSPQTDIPDKEYEQIMTFIQKGGNIEFFMPPNSSSEPFANISKIMDNFGIGMNYDTVSDEVYTAPNNNTDAFLIDFVEYTPASYAADGTVEYEGDEVDLTSEVISIATEGDYTIDSYFPLSRSFYADTTEENVKFASLITTYYDDNMHYAVGTPTGGPYKDTEVISGSILTLSAYSVNKDQDDAALVVFGANILNNDSAQSALYINPLNLFLVSITWLHETDINLAIPPKVITYDNMTFQDQKEADMMIVLLIIIPAVVAAFGVLAWYKRGRISG
jgi:hypothetical protein